MQPGPGLQGPVVTGGRMPVRILGICGSPVRGGNTEAFLSDQFVGRIRKEISLEKAAKPEAFDDLDAPVLRVNSLDAPAIYSPGIENEQLPGAKRIIAKVLSIA